MIKKLKEFKMPDFFLRWGSLIVGLISNQLFLFFLHLIAGRNLSLEDFGVFNIFIVLASIGSIVTQIGFLQVITREIARDRNNFKFLFNKTSLLFVFSFIVVSFLIVGYIVYFEGITDSIFIIMTIGLTLGMFLWNYFEAFFFGIECFKYSYSINFVIPIIFLILIFFNIVEYKEFDKLIGLFVSYFFSKNIIYGYFYQKEYRSYKKINYVFTINEYIKPVSKFFMIHILSLPVSYLPTIFLSLNLSKTEVAVFSASNKISLALNLIITSLNKVIYPKLSALYKQDRKKFLTENNFIFNLVLVLAMIFTLFVSSMSKEIILLLWGEKFVNTIQIFALQSWVTLLALLHSVIGVIAFSGNYEHKIVKYSFINAILVLSLSYYFSFSGSFYMVIAMGTAYFISYMLHFNAIINGELFLKQKIKQFVFLLLILLFASISSYIAHFAILSRLLILLSELVLLIIVFSIMNKSIFTSIKSRIFTN